MKRYALLAATAVVGVGVAFQGSVNLQATSPGSPQTGNLNVTGTAKAGTIVGSSNVATGIAYGGDFRSVSDQGRGVLGNANSPTGVTYGGLFQAASSSGRGVAGISTATTGTAAGGFFTANSTQGKGVQGTSNAVTGTNYGVYGKTSSPDGFGVYSAGNVGVTGNLGIGTGTGNPSHRLRVQDDQNNVSGGSLTVSNGAYNGFSLGRGAIVAIASGDGPYAMGLGAGSHSPAGASYGVYGSATGNGSRFGVYGITTGAGLGYAGYFSGLLYAISASSGVKSFMIDHPMDPANKVLTHSSIESDERMNLYRGSVTTDSNGAATITLPAWFEALNEDIQYQLTVVENSDSDNFTLCKVAKQLKNGRFKIRTSMPGIQVNWQVTGRRHDPTSNYYPMEVERMKTAEEKGKYYAPEAHGKDKSAGIGYIPQQSSQGVPNSR